MGIPVNVQAFTFAAMFHGLSGCAVAMQGLVHEHGGSVVLQTPGGDQYRLVTLGEASPVAHLDGHLAEIEGRRVFKTITVEDWAVREGLHGMTAWVGELRWLGAQLSIHDRNSGAVYILDPASNATLGEHVDQIVLVEGYVIGPNEVKVLYFRALE